MDRDGSSAALGEYRGFRLEASPTRPRWWEGWAIRDEPGDDGESKRVGFYVEEVSLERVHALLRQRVDAWHGVPHPGKPDSEPDTTASA